MNSSSNLPLKNGVFPEGRLASLVLAAVQPEKSAEHWAKYVQETAETFPNEGEFRIFPFVAWNIRQNTKQPITDCWLLDADTWAQQQMDKNEALRHKLGALFTSADLQVAWTKGTAISRQYYPTIKERPSGDLDAICQWESVEKLMQLAGDNDWEKHIGPRKLNMGARVMSPELSYDFGKEGALDMQWQPRMPFTFDTAMVDHIFTTGKPLDADGMLYASATWLLMETIEHGLSYNKVHSIRWVVDALQMLKTDPEGVDWDAFVDMAARYRLGLIMVTGLKALQPFTDHIPDHVITSLKKQKTTGIMRDELAARFVDVGLEDSYMTQRRYNLFLRAPLMTYAVFAPSPVTAAKGLSVRARLAIAWRNLYSRVAYPFLRIAGYGE